MTQLIENKGRSQFLFDTFGRPPERPVRALISSRTRATARSMPQSVPWPAAVFGSVDDIMTNFLLAAGICRTGVRATGG